MTDETAAVDITEALSSPYQTFTIHFTVTSDEASDLVFDVSYLSALEAEPWEKPSYTPKWAKPR